MLHEVQVVGNHHDAVSRSHATHGDEADKGGDADVVQLEIGENQPAHDCERDVDQHLKRERRALEIPIKHHEDRDEDDG